jgi:hypothetical protein
MTKTTRIAAAIAALALASAALYAQQSNWLAQGASLELPVPSSDLTPPSVAADGSRIEAAPNLPNDYGVTHADVGDADSFGRNLKWLGAMNGFVYFGSTCPRANAPAWERCQPIVAQTVETPFAFGDIASIRLPARASTSLLCQWVTPILSLTHQNTTNTRTYSYFRYWPTITIVSGALSDPASINTITGQSFGGKLIIPMTSHGAWINKPLEPGVVFGERSRDSQVCLGGVLNRRVLIESYGMSEELADKLFASPMDVSLSVQGNLRNVREGYLTLGVRMVGD